MNGHPAQNAAAAQRDPMDAWRGIVALVRSGNVSEMKISSISRQRAVLAIDTIITRLASIDPIHRFECDICHALSYDVPFRHAPDCIWLAVQAAKEG